MEDIFQNILNWFIDNFWHLGSRLIITLVLIIITFGLRRLFLGVIFRKYIHKAARSRWKRNSAYISLFFLFIILFPVWLPSILNFIAVIGIFGAGVLIVLKEVILNIAGWLFILIRRPFTEGNRISIGGFTGDVIDIRFLEFAMMEVKSREQGGLSTGRVMHVPNSWMFTHPLANASKEFSFNWNELKIPLTPDSDWKHAIEIVQNIVVESLEEISDSDKRILRSEEEYAITYKKLTPTVYVEFKSGAVILTLRHLIEPHRISNITDQLWRAILTEFASEKKITLSDIVISDL